MSQQARKTPRDMLDRERPAGREPQLPAGCCAAARCLLLLPAIAAATLLLPAAAALCPPTKAVADTASLCWQLLPSLE